MKLHLLLAGLVCSVVTSWASADSLAWNDPSISDGACNAPPPIVFPTYLVNTLKGLPLGERVYLPFGNAAYYRWVYQKVNGGNAATIPSQLLDTKPRVTFPSVIALLNLSIGRVDVYGLGAMGKWYTIQAFPKNLFATVFDVKVVAASPGSASADFGGKVIPSRYVWADDSALVEWHCFAGDVQVVNVISLNKTLTSAQTTAISSFLENYGFQPKNFMSMPY